MDQMLAGLRTAPLVEEKIITLNGNVIEMDVQASPYNNDETLGILVIFQNASARKHAEQILRSHVWHADFIAAIGLGLSPLQSLLF